jgi:diaminohydroxyphosphoribosylaminopyrimidine deaminase/5-amino-6-(5-phosphoribosylamino)uracil reductase
MTESRERGAEDGESRYSASDRLCMRIALAEAAKGLGLTSPNPAVGAVLAVGGKLLGLGHHRCAGGWHAEKTVLEPLRDKDLSEATLYTNLEPCCHYGATPPCTELILARGVGRVVSSIRDPNPVVSGKGFAALERGGVRVAAGLMEREALRLNEAYLTRVKLGRPFVAAKLAVTMDGRIADASGRSQWITGVKARKLVHHLRSRFDGVVVGARTALMDDPHLNVRMVRGRDPVRIVLDPDLESLRRRSNLAESDGGRTVYVCSPGRPDSKATLAESLGVDLWEVPQGPEGLDLRLFLRRAAAEGLSSLLVEGGAHTVTFLTKARLIDKLYLFTAPKLIGGGTPWLGDIGLGGLADAPGLEDLTVKKVGDDVLYSGYLKWREG